MDAGDEEPTRGYAWEGDLERSWETIQEDESGRLKVYDPATKPHRQRRLEIARNVRKGLIRYMCLAIDLSRGMSEKDWKPHRLSCVQTSVSSFVKDYFDQNPISQLGVIGIQGLQSSKLSDLSGNPKQHISHIESATAVSSEPSLQNALELAKSSLKTVPSYGSREILCVYGSLVTADPGDIFATVAALKREKIRVSFIGIGAEMRLLRYISEQTHGNYYVASDANHMTELLTNFTFPSPTVVSNAAKFATLVEMGFPQRKTGSLSLCTCHEAFTTIGYLCPRCQSKSCELPTTCKVCSLPLVSSPHLARSYHHLFPIPKFETIKTGSGQRKVCFACLKQFGKEERYQCGGCQNEFCEDCDIYVHDSLHNCPGCC